MFLNVFRPEVRRRFPTAELGRFQESCQWEQRWEDTLLVLKCCFMNHDRLCAEIGDSKDDKGHHPKRSPWFPMLLWTAFRSIYCCLLLCSWLNHNLSKMHSLFCIYQHINSQLCDIGLLYRPRKNYAFFTANVGKSLFFFLKRWSFVQEIDFVFYWELSVHMEGRRKKENGQMREGIKVTAGESLLQEITNYRIFSLTTKLNRFLWNNKV